MNELSPAEQRALDLGQLVRREMDPATAAVELARILRRDRARHTSHAVLATILALGALALLTQTSPRPPHLALADGTTVQALSDDLDLVVRETDTATQFELAEGGGRFDVAHRSQRPVRVRAGAVVVEVLGTRFDVARAADSVTVEVLNGRVQVHAPAGRIVLTAGQRQIFDARVTPDAAPSAPVTAAPVSVVAPDSTALDSIAPKGRGAARPEALLAQ